MAIDFETTEWADHEQGGTPITAAQLNRMEAGIAAACHGVDTLAEGRLQTYRVASGGDTATQDADGAAIVGPCLVFDEGICGTYYEPGPDAGDRRLISSADEIAALRDSVSHAGEGGVLRGVDLDGVRAAGTYMYNDACSHTPSPGVYGVLLVLAPGQGRGEVAQVAVSAAAPARCRWLFGNPLAWSPWA